MAVSKHYRLRIVFSLIPVSVRISWERWTSIRICRDLQCRPGTVIPHSMAFLERSFEEPESNVVAPEICHISRLRSSLSLLTSPPLNDGTAKNDVVPVEPLFFVRDLDSWVNQNSWSTLDMGVKPM